MHILTSLRRAMGTAACTLLIIEVILLLLLQRSGGMLDALLEHLKLTAQHASTSFERRSQARCGTQPCIGSQASQVGGMEDTMYQRSLLDLNMMVRSEPQRLACCMHQQHVLR